jgi:hypothetical protein
MQGEKVLQPLISPQWSRQFCYEGKTLYGQGKPQQTGMTAEIYSIPTYAI